MGPAIPADARPTQSKSKADGPRSRPRHLTGGLLEFHCVVAGDVGGGLGRVGRHGVTTQNHRRGRRVSDQKLLVLRWPPSREGGQPMRSLVRKKVDRISTADLDSLGSQASAWVFSFL